MQHGATTPTLTGPVRHARPDGTLACTRGPTYGCGEVAVVSLWSVQRWPAKYLGDACEFHASRAIATRQVGARGVS